MKNRTAPRHCGTGKLRWQMLTRRNAPRLCGPGNTEGSVPLQGRWDPPSLGRGHHQRAQQMQGAQTCPIGTGRCNTTNRCHWRGSGREKGSMSSALAAGAGPTVLDSRQHRPRPGQSQQSALVIEGGQRPRLLTESQQVQTSRDNKPPHIGRPGKRERHNHGDPFADRQACSRIA